jgi:predicted  nucleic acid-binding Zn-ribbon protein
MNKHFEDTLYYLGRAGEHAKEGVMEELDPLEERVRELTGSDEEEEPEPSRLQKLQDDLQELEARAEGEAKTAIADARERIRRYRGDDASE